jgi:hypothetical protein
MIEQADKPALAACATKCGEADTRRKPEQGWLKWPHSYVNCGKA